MHAARSPHRAVRRPRVAAAALVAAVVTTLAGCGDGQAEPGAGADLQGQLRDLPGVRDAAAGEVTIEEDTTGTRAVVDMEAGASAQDLEDVVAVVADADVRESAVYLDAGTLDYDRGVASSAVFDVSPRTDPASTVALLEAGESLVVDVPRARVAVAPDPDGESPEAEPTVTLDAPEANAEALADVAAAAVGDDALAGARLVFAGGPEDLPPGVSASSLTAGPDGLTPEVVDTWRQLATAVDEAPVEALPSYDAERALVDVYLVVEDGVVAADVTPASYDGGLRPVVEDLLDAVIEAPRGTTLQVWAARDYVLQASAAGVVGPARPGTWGAFVDDYLAGAPSVD